MSAKNMKSLTRKQVSISITSISPGYSHGIKVKYTHTNTYCKDPGSDFMGSVRVLQKSWKGGEKERPDQPSAVQGCGKHHVNDNKK